MNALRFSLAKLLGVVVLVALGLAALVNATEWWARIAMTTTLATLFFGVTLAVSAVGQQRAFWFAFVLIGGGYFLVALLTWSPRPSTDSPNLVTSELLRYVHNRVSRPESSQTALPGFDGVLPIVVRADGSFQVAGKQVGLAALKTQIAAADGRVFVYATAESRSKAIDEISKLGGSIMGNGTVSFTPSYTHFGRIGHCIWTLLFAFLGGLIARYFYATRERAT